jgi:hypothetical protein
MSTSIASKEEVLWATRSMSHRKRESSNASTTSSGTNASSGSTNRQRSDDNSSSSSSYESNGESRPTSGSLLASLGNGIRGAISSMKETASNLLSSPARRKANQSAALSDEEPKNTSSGVVQDSYSMSSGAGPCCEDRNSGDGDWTPISATGNLNSEPHGAVVSPNYWIVPKRIARLAKFLLENKIDIMFNLLSRVSLRSINHENICCLNSAITILVFENRRYLLMGPLLI